jgi:hypothetical protein
MKQKNPLVGTQQIKPDQYTQPEYQTHIHASTVHVEIHVYHSGRGAVRFDLHISTLIM